MTYEKTFNRLCGSLKDSSEDTKEIAKEILECLASGIMYYRSNAIEINEVNRIKQGISLLRRSGFGVTKSSTPGYVSITDTK